jgi:quercetin dioxygenase-like cupin family protein
MTLKELGRASGLSHPFLSQLERGLARPSVRSAERIAEALDVPVAGLWSARCGRAVVVRRDEGEHERVREWTGGSKNWPEEHEVAAGEVVLYVARGSVAVDLDGEIHELEEGDTLLFDGGVPHRLRRTGGASTRVLRVTTT